MPVCHQAITWTKADLLSVGPLGTNFTEIQMEIQIFSFMKMHVKLLSAKMAAILSRGGEELDHIWLGVCEGDAADAWVW